MELLCDKPEPIIAILGPACSLETMYIAQVVEFWNIVQVIISKYTSYCDIMSNQPGRKPAS